MPIDATTFAASVATSVVAATVVEQVVKPRVEANKERRAARRELMSRMVGLSLSAGVLAEELPKDMSREVRDRVRAEQVRQEERLRLIVQQLFDDSGRFVAVYGGPLRQLLVEYAMCVHGLMLSSRTRLRKAQIIKELNVPVATALDPERQRLWYVLGNVRALREASRIITSTHSDQRDEPEEPVERRRIPRPSREAVRRQEGSASLDASRRET
ncbi:hypothetical protein [Micromonospora siamensis]|uniref:Uncharacterized protein n=1 Tax=Micromonospora siamensis TaxID=299152 RepID=A0A1C5H0V3_9ACTN|nr:hypothetical protein [Micromonospora siamensis]SCG39665.1 hypothetical protein GA0074704_0857 [Micromonospora siamensis]